jgi:hypothetical protein
MAKKHTYTSGSGHIELTMTLTQARTASHPGMCDGDVRDLSRDPAIRKQLDKLDPFTLTSELREFGAWDSYDLANHEQNLQRILWIAAGDIVEQHHECAKARAFLKAIAK